MPPPHFTLKLLWFLILGDRWRKQRCNLHRQAASHHSQFTDFSTPSTHVASKLRYFCQISDPPRTDPPQNPQPSRMRNCHLSSWRVVSCASTASNGASGWLICWSISISVGPRRWTRPGPIVPQELESEALESPGSFSDVDGLQRVRDDRMRSDQHQHLNLWFFEFGNYLGRCALYPRLGKK